ncbi:Ig-like domain-containing protein [Trichocoleus sp. FACHB-262]|uniref:Ig-like domain-containing protein n=1 Tax=Trichocoleus sp. FACHB-262 TaxID=2692869 RepID=UPI0016840271|nr:tandem-95 repeat protein [Trichocoleus sp. FACHB-262]MBD2121237.1 tandem-95 repeat protein [Trichocoleus sp. FACHB-262]
MSDLYESKNDPMPINNDAVTVNEDTVVSINVLGNDSSTDGSLLTIVNFSQATNGSVSSNGDGTFTYTPNANFNGSDSYTYVVDSGTGTESATVAITVSPIDDAPIASDDTFTTNENTAISLSVLANDFDAEGNVLTIINFTDAAHGTLTQNASGDFLYTPNSGFTGADSFSYIISDGNGGTSQASVTISVGSGSTGGLGSINGTPSDDTLLGTNGDDTIYGYGGNDTVNPGLGYDYVDGGEGKDTLVIDYSALDYMYSYPSVYGNGSGYYYGYSYGGNGYSNISFSNIERFNITGTANNDSIFGSYGDDVLNGGAGDDLIFSDGGIDTIDGGAGEDALKDADFSTNTTNLTFNDVNPISSDFTFTNGTTVKNVEFLDGLTTGSGNDTISFSRQRNNTVNTGDGNDTINSGLGQDYVDGGEGEDTLVLDYSSLDYMYGGYPSVYGSGSGYYYGYGANGSSNISFSNIEHLRVSGTANNDIFGGGSGSDVLNGGAGNDVISGGGGADLIDGGAGEDGLGDADFSANTTGLSFSDATAIAGNITLANGTVATNVEFIDGLTTGSGNDTINFSRQRNNTINTGAGNDKINSGLGYDYVDGGEGEDTLVIDYSALNSMSGGFDYYSPSAGYFLGYGTDSYSSINFSNIEHLNVTGTANNDIFRGGSGSDVLNGGAGNDVISGGGGADKIDGGAGEDALNDADFSTATKNLTFGDTGSISKELKLANGTVITNIEFFDGLTTGGGNDTINYSRYRNNTINTGSGNDNINAGLGADTVDGGAGDDLLHIDYSSLSYMYGYNYSNGGGYYSGYSANGYNSISFSNIERLNITGTISSDSLYGGDGNDTLSDGFGNDYISGGAGTDTLNDGAGSDTLIGGAGNDAIALTNDGFSNTIFYTNGDGSDTVKQFRRGAGGDVIFFSGIAAVDVVKSGNGTQLRLSDGISNNAGFGKGALLVTLAETAGFAAADVNINLLSNDGGQFLFA